MVFNRRTALIGILALGAAPVVPAIASAAQTVSPRMAQIIAEYKAIVATLDSLDPKTDPDGWQAADDAFWPAQGKLLDARPATMADFVAKFDALVGLEYA